MVYLTFAQNIQKKQINEIMVDLYISNYCDWVMKMLLYIPRYTRI